MTPPADADDRRGERTFISISATAAIVCGVILLVLLVQVTHNRAQLELQHDGVGEFNFVQQLDHNFDVFANSVLALRIERATNGGSLAPLEASSDIVRRFDVLYSVVRGIGNRFAGSLGDFTSGQAALVKMNRFIDEYDNRVMAGQILSDADLDVLAADSQDLAKDVYQLGLELFRHKSRLHDEVSRRSAYLTRVSWFFGASFVLAGLTLYILLARASRRASELFHQARSSQRQLETALEELTTGDIQRKSQNRFLATATHDLRQPLQAMQYYITALGSHIPSERGKEILGKIARSADSAQGMLSGLLDISKLDAGVIEPKLESVNLGSVLMGLHTTHAADAQDKGLALLFDTTDVAVRTDAQFLERILSNLIGNAVNYTPSGSVSVRVTADANAEVVTISVEDTGIGIPEREQEAVFNEYYQVARTDDNIDSIDPDKGMGLGLSIVRRYVRLLDAPLEVWSQPGQGTRFSLTLPLSEQTPTHFLEGVTEPLDSPRTLGGLAIMIIDDDEPVRDGVVALLEQLGCEVLASSDQNSAIEELIDKDRVPDLMLADYQLLDGATGVDVIEAVREEVNEDVPAILVTGDTTPEPVQAAQKYGFGLLHKPVSSQALVTAIRACLNQSTLGRPLTQHSGTEQDDPTAAMAPIIDHKQPPRTA